MIDRPDTPHADVLLDGIWEEEITPDDLASRSLSAAQASSYAFRVASEGTAATAQLEGEVHEFLESETGTWAKSFIGIVRVGESLVHVSRALGEMARNLQQVNLEQSEIVQQVEAEIEALERALELQGEDPTPQIEALIADGRAKATEAAARMAVSEVELSQPNDLDESFMAFGRVPGASATFQAAVKASGNVKPPPSRAAAAQDAFADSMDDTEAPRLNGFAFGRAPSINGVKGVNGTGVVNGVNGTAHTNGTVHTNGTARPNGEAVNGDATVPAVNGFSFGRIPTVNGTHAPSTPVENDLPASGEKAVPPAAPVEPTDPPTGTAVGRVPSGNGTNGFSRTWASPDDTPARGEGSTPVVPPTPPVTNGNNGSGPITFMSFGRVPSADGAPWSPPTGPTTGPVPVVPAGAAAMPLFGAGAGADDEASTGETDETVDGPVAESFPTGPVAASAESASAQAPAPDRDVEPEPLTEGTAEEYDAAAALVSGFLSFGRVPGGTNPPSGEPQVEAVDRVEANASEVVAPEVVAPAASVAETVAETVADETDQDSWGGAAAAPRPPPPPPRRERRRTRHRRGHSRIRCPGCR